MEIIAFLDAAIDLYTGEMTCTEFILIIEISAILAIIIYRIIRRKVRESRGQA